MSEPRPMTLFDSPMCCPDPDERLIVRIERMAQRTMDAGELT